MKQDLPLVIDIDTLNALINSGDIKEYCLIDVCSAERFLNEHIPTALHVTPADTQNQSGIAGYIPEPERLQALINRLGIQEGTHCIIYDDEGGGWAGRLIWLLDEIGHSHYSYVDGGFTAWKEANLTTESGPCQTFDQGRAAVSNGQHTIGKQQILEQLGQENFAIWDARSKAEHTGEKANSKRGGHIPGAAHMDWLDIMDKQRALRFRDLDTLQQELNELGLTQNKLVVTHCQTHHRSGLTYLVMKVLGYPNYLAYSGSWGEWGNDPNLPVATSL